MVLSKREKSILANVLTPDSLYGGLLNVLKYPLQFASVHTYEIKYSHSGLHEIFTFESNNRTLVLIQSPIPTIYVDETL